MFTLNCYKKLSALKPRIIIRPFLVLFAIKKNQARIWCKYQKCLKIHHLFTKNPKPYKIFILTDNTMQSLLLKAIFQNNKCINTFNQKESRIQVFQLRYITTEQAYESKRLASRFHIFIIFVYSFDLGFRCRSQKKKLHVTQEQYFIYFF